MEHRSKSADQCRTETAEKAVATGLLPMSRALIALELSTPMQDMNTIFVNDKANRELQFFGERSIGLSDLNEIHGFFVQAIPDSTGECMTLRNYDGSQIIAHSSFTPQR